MNTPEIGIIGSHEDWTNQQITIALEKRGVKPHFFNASRFSVYLKEKCAVWSKEINLSELDLLLVRHIPSGSLEQIIYRMDVLHQLEDSGTCIINKPKTIEKMVDKYYTSFLLANAGLPTPETILTENTEEALKAFELLGGDVILKPLFGSRGRGMVRLSNEDMALRAFQALELGGYLYYLQRFIPHYNRDYRLLIIGNCLIGAMERHSSNWKCNLAQGGKAYPCSPSAEMIDLSLQASNVLEADYCGVDLLQGEDGTLYVVEVNSMPSWVGLQAVCDKDIAAAFVEYILEQL